MGEALRLDKWLWYARFFKSRSLAARLLDGRKVRVNRRLIDKASRAVHVGDVLTFPQGRRIRVVRVAALGSRRGPAREAESLYEDLAPVGESTAPRPRRWPRAARGPAGRPRPSAAPPRR